MKRKRTRNDAGKNSVDFMILRSIAAVMWAPMLAVAMILGAGEAMGEEEKKAKREISSPDEAEGIILVPGYPKDTPYKMRAAPESEGSGKTKEGLKEKQRNQESENTGIVPGTTQQFEELDDPNWRSQWKEGYIPTFARDFQFEEADKLEPQYILTLPHLDLSDPKVSADEFSAGRKGPWILAEWKFIGERVIEGQLKNVWLTAISSLNAKMLRIGFSNYHLPQGARLVIYTQMKGGSRGWINGEVGKSEHVFANNGPRATSGKGSFSAGPYKGDTIFLEFSADVRMPGPDTHSYFSIQYINHSFISWYEMSKSSSSIDRYAANSGSSECLKNICK